MAKKMSAEALEGLGQRVATTMCCTFSVMTGETQREARITSEDWYAMLAHIAALQSEADRLREALAIQNATLLEARATFQEYVRLHRAKSPPDEAKAQANFAQADKIGVALAKARAALSATAAPK